ncbi:hypothetical protein HY380_01445 [Candidatus Saccharibacteria bacterium]|nr:hypothetical protein [Candidatus Saccharibacteria bacterium]
MVKLSNRVKLGGLIIVAAIGVGIWQLTKGDSQSSISSGINTAVQDKCQDQIGDATFCKFAGYFSNAGSYKVSATTTSDSGTSTIDLASDTSGNSEMVIKQNNQEQASIVYYNGISYQKDYTDGKWFKFESGATNAPTVTDLKSEFVKGDFDKNEQGKKITYKSAGTEACGNLTCYKYFVSEASSPPSSGHLWFDNRDYLLRKVTVNSGGSSTEMNLTYEGVSISEPSPTKPVPTSGQ